MTGIPFSIKFLRTSEKSYENDGLCGKIFERQDSFNYVHSSHDENKPVFQRGLQINNYNSDGELPQILIAYFHLRSVQLQLGKQH
jgi:hypothetical protein